MLENQNNQDQHDGNPAHAQAGIGPWAASATIYTHVCASHHHHGKHMVLCWLEVDGWRWDDSNAPRSKTPQMVGYAEWDGHLSQWVWSNKAPMVYPMAWRRPIGQVHTQAHMVIPEQTVKGQPVQKRIMVDPHKLHYMLPGDFIMVDCGERWVEVRSGHRLVMMQHHPGYPCHHWVPNEILDHSMIQMGYGDALHPAVAQNVDAAVIPMHMHPDW